MRWIHKFLLGLLAGILVANTGLAQDLQTVWNQYLQTETAYQRVLLHESRLIANQSQLREKQQQLQQSQTWYNSWIIKIRLSGINEDLVAIADSLGQIRESKAQLQQQKSEQFSTFKSRYFTWLQQTPAVRNPDAHWARQSELIVRTITNNNSPDDILPNYTRIVNKLYDNEQTRQMVLTDLRKVLMQKITIIDSLLQSRQNDLALLKSMSDFQKDINLQTESATDLSHQSGSVDKSSPESYFSGIGGNDSRTSEQEGLNPANITEPAQSIHTGEQTVRQDIRQLESRRRQYQQLLQTIAKEQHN